MPSSRPSRRIPSTIAASDTASAVPPLSRIARSIRKSPTARGTRRPSAMVCASVTGAAASRPSANALTMGAQPSACTEIMRGRAPGAIQPMASSSSKPFHIPISPVPPPVG